MKAIILTGVVLGSLLGVAEAATPADSRTAFLKQQAIAEMQRVSAQVEVLATNQEELSGRVTKAEELKTEVASLRAEIDALKASMAELRQRLESQHGEIVKELSTKIATLQPTARANASHAAVEVDDENVCFYTVKSGDSLFLIAKAFGTSVAKLKALNGMKSDRIGVGQKIKVPKE